MLISVNKSGGQTKQVGRIPPVEIKERNETKPESFETDRALQLPFFHDEFSKRNASQFFFKRNQINSSISAKQSATYLSAFVRNSVHASNFSNAFVYCRVLPGNLMIWTAKRKGFYIKDKTKQ